MRLPDSYNGGAFGFLLGGIGRKQSNLTGAEADPLMETDRRATIAYHGWRRLSGLYLRSCWRARGN